MSSDIAIRVNDLSKRYTLQHTVKDEHGNDTNELWALKDVSFEVKQGESVGIIGPNGSGKSTLLKILAGVSKPTSGRIEVRGRVASILDIGAGFHPELSGRENVFLNGQILGFRKKEIQSKFDEIVAFSGIEKFIDEPIKNYSNGMYLRLAFSIIAHLDFDVYLLDEIISVGDSEFRQKINSQMLKQRSSRTQIIVGHDINLLKILTNRILISPKMNSSNETINNFNYTLNSNLTEVCTKYSLDIKKSNTKLHFYIELFFKKIPLFPVDIAIVFTSIDLTNIFAVSSLHSLNNFYQTKEDFNEKNNLIFYFELEQKMINQNTYLLDIIIIKDKNEVVQKINNAGRLEIDYMISEDTFINSYPGALKVFADWKTLKTNAI